MTATRLHFSSLPNSPYFFIGSKSRWPVVSSFPSFLYSFYRLSNLFCPEYSWNTARCTLSNNQSINQSIEDRCSTYMSFIIQIKKLQYTTRTLISLNQMFPEKPGCFYVMLHLSYKQRENDDLTKWCKLCIFKLIFINVYIVKWKLRY